MKKYDDYDLRDGKSGYQWCLEMAGARVIAYEEFGSYQGDWLAKVEYKGKVGWIHDYYGSCSGCDAFQAETGYEYRTKKQWIQFCKQFAKEYLEDMKTYQEVLKEVSGDMSWDLDGRDMVDWLKRTEAETMSSLPVQERK